MATDNIETDQDHGKIIAEWEYQNYTQPKRTMTWYVIAAIFLLGCIIFSLATQDYLFIVIVAIVIAIYVMRSRRGPMPPLTFQIAEDGLLPDAKTLYEWKDIKNFWIVYEPPKVKNLYIEFKSGLRPSITIPLEDQNPLKIRKTLLDFIPEDTEKENESITDGISRILKL